LNVLTINVVRHLQGRNPVRYGKECSFLLMGAYNIAFRAITLLENIVAMCINSRSLAMKIESLLCTRYSKVKGRHVNLSKSLLL
jgi:hypothetical protein